MSEESDFLEALFGKAERSEPEQAETVVGSATDLRAQVGEAAGLPAELVDRLRGNTAEELTADAHTLARLLPTPEPELSRQAEARLLAEQAIAHAERTRHLLGVRLDDEGDGD